MLVWHSVFLGKRVDIPYRRNRLGDREKYHAGFCGI